MISISHTIDGIQVSPYKDSKQTNLVATFGEEVQPSLNVDSVVFVNSASNNNSDTVRSLFNSNSVEGGTYTKSITDGTTTLNLDYFFDYSKLEYLADNKTKVGLIRDRSLNSLLDYNGADITMQLLIYRGLLQESDYTTVPYRAINRKTLLERLQIIANAYVIFKTTQDEIFKLFSIASNLTSITNPAKLALAGINLVGVLVSLTNLVNRINALVDEIGKTIFTPIRYHKGIKLKTIVTKGLDYLGYTVDFGTYWTESDNIVLLGSKNEEGVLFVSNIANEEGILQPNDYGYTLAEQFELCKKLANCQMAIINNVVHIKPRKDPFWLQNSSYVLPSVQIGENLFFNNGVKRFNFEDLNAGLIIKYQTDNSDYWTIDDRATDLNGRTISVATVEPINVNQAHRVNLTGIKTVDIPYALCTRVGKLEGLSFLFQDLTWTVDDLVDRVKGFFSKFANKIGGTAPAIVANVSYDPKIEEFAFLKTENGYFSTPKIVYLQGNKIPSNFDSLIGAKAIYEKYYAFDSLVSGVRNPNNPNDTNCKEVYTGVKINLTLSDFKEILNNSYFSSSFGNGKFTKVEYNPNKGSATVDFWIQKQWLNNVKEIVK